MKPYAFRARTTAVFVFVGLLAGGCRADAPSTQSTRESAARAGATHPEPALIEGLVLASRMLARPQLDVMGAQGHVSVRSQQDPTRYDISRYVSPGIVSTSDVIENDLDSNRVGGARSDQFEEVHIHGQIN